VSDSAAPHDPDRLPSSGSVFDIPAFRRFFFGNLLSLLGLQMQATAIAWEVYSRTGDNLQVGIAALLQFLPVLLLGLPAGFLADRWNRRRIVQGAMAGVAVCSTGLAVVSLGELPLPFLQAGLFLNGLCRAAQQPAKASLIPLIVPRDSFRRAVTWTSGGFQFACIAGPALAMLVIAVTGRPGYVYLFEAVSAAAFALVLGFVRMKPQQTTLHDDPVRELQAGFQFVWKSKVILASISLDLFAVLLGGATALLPVYSKQILDLERDLAFLRPIEVWARAAWGGPEWDLAAVGCGIMRSAPAVGALAMSFWMASRPPMLRAGRNLLLSVAGFGVATVLFGISRSFWLSTLLLFLTGVCDMISVVIRHTLIQLLTPDALRGRVQAINGLFIGASNELGGFESGLVAHLFEREGDPAFGPTVSVVSGGLGTMLVVAYVAVMSPQLRRYGPLETPRGEAPTPENVESGPRIRPGVAKD